MSKDCGVSIREFQYEKIIFLIQKYAEKFNYCNDSWYLDILNDKVLGLIEINNIENPQIYSDLIDIFYYICYDEVECFKRSKLYTKKNEIVMSGFFVEADNS